MAFLGYLRQSTASQTRMIGPFVDSTDGDTAETGLTIANTDVRLSKNGANIAAKNSGGATHDELGMYALTFDATDTDTVGELSMTIKITGALVVTGNYTVLEENVYDMLFASGADLGTTVDGIVTTLGAAGAGLSAIPWNASWDAEVQSEVDDALTAYNAVATTDLPSNFADLAIVASTGQVGIDLATINTPAGPIPELGILEGGTAQGATSTTLTGRSAATDDIVQAGHVLWAFGSTQGYWQAVVIDSVAGDVFTIAAWPVATPSGTITYRVFGTPPNSANLLPAVNVTSWNSVALSTTNPLPNAAPAANGGLPTVNASNYVAGLQGTLNTLDDIDTAQDTQHSTTRAKTLAYIQLIARSDSAIETDNSTELTEINADGGSGAGNYSAQTDAIEAIRDRGDAAWTTGAGGTPPQLLNSTTIATLTSQIIFTLTAGSADDDAYNGAIAVITNQSTATQKAVATVSDYVGSTRTVTLSSDPGIFTVAVGDTIEIIAALGTVTATDVNVTSWNSVALSTTNPLPNAAPAANGGLPTVNASNYVAGLQGTLNTLDALDTAQDTRHDETQADIATAQTDITAILADTDAIQSGSTIVNANVEQINTVALTGDGSGTPFGV